MADAAEELDVVTLESHAGTSTEAEAAAGELVTDLLDGDREAGREPFDDDREGRAVRFTRSQVAQHTARLPGSRPAPPLFRFGVSHARIGRVADAKTWRESVPSWAWSIGSGQ